MERWSGVLRWRFRSAVKSTEQKDGPEGSLTGPALISHLWDRERAFSVVDAMRPIAEAHDCSVARIVQAWLLQQPGITSIIIGAKTRDATRGQSTGD